MTSAMDTARVIIVRVRAARWNVGSSGLAVSGMAVGGGREGHNGGEGESFLTRYRCCSAETMKVCMQCVRVLLGACGFSNLSQYKCLSTAWHLPGIYMYK